MDSGNSTPISSPVMDEDELEIIGPTKRKNKSLLALCKRFLELYPLDMPEGSSLDIPLEHLSDTLKLSRRRLYDIINIMESLQMAVKVTKNLYRWYGTRNVQALLSQLKDMSDRELCIELIQLKCPPTPDITEQQLTKPMQPPCTPLGDTSAQSLLIRSMAQLPQYKQTPCTPQETSTLILTPMAAPPTPQTSSKKQKCSLNSMKESPEPKRPHHWKMKSLGGTCLKFLTLFFKHQTVSLDWAGRVLLCGDDEEKPSSQERQEDTSAKEQDRQLRNKVRRIYDVANVLSALGLVCKISPRNSSSRKLLYAYSGPAIGSLTPAVQETATIEPPKPVRRVKKQELEIDNVNREQRQNTEGVCKRRLDLYKVQDSPHCKRLLQDDTVIEDSSSALSILLAVAEQEFKGFTTPRAEAHVAQNSLPEQLKTCKIDKPKPVCNQTSNQSMLNQQGKDNLSSNQENACRGKEVGSKQIPNQSISFNYGNRSALRSLLENNRTAPVKSEFPIIQKFVVLNEESIQSRIAVTNKPVQTVLIRNVSGACQVVRRNALSIPYQLNMNNRIATPRIVTHLDIGLGTPQ